jgi:hypothetical protein
MDKILTGVEARRGSIRRDLMSVGRNAVFGWQES